MPWSRNRAYHKAAMEHAVEQQWSIPGSNNGACHGATMEQ